MEVQGGTVSRRGGSFNNSSSSSSSSSSRGGGSSNAPGVSTVPGRGGSVLKRTGNSSHGRIVSAKADAVQMGLQQQKEDQEDQQKQLQKEVEQHQVMQAIQQQQQLAQVQQQQRENAEQQQEAQAVQQQQALLQQQQLQLVLEEARQQQRQQQCVVSESAGCLSKIKPVNQDTDTRGGSTQSWSSSLTLSGITNAEASPSTPGQATMSSSASAVSSSGCQTAGPPFQNWASAVVTPFAEDSFKIEACCFPSTSLGMCTLASAVSSGFTEADVLGAVTSEAATEPQPSLAMHLGGANSAATLTHGEDKKQLMPGTPAIGRAKLCLEGLDLEAKLPARMHSGSCTTSTISTTLTNPTTSAATTGTTNILTPGDSMLNTLTIECHELEAGSLPASTGTVPMLLSGSRETHLRPMTMTPPPVVEVSNTSSKPLLPVIIDAGALGAQSKLEGSESGCMGMDVGLQCPVVPGSPLGGHVNASDFALATMAIQQQQGQQQQMEQQASLSLLMRTASLGTQQEIWHAGVTPAIMAKAQTEWRQSVWSKQVLQQQQQVQAQAQVQAWHAQQQQQQATQPGHQHARQQQQHMWQTMQQQQQARQLPPPPPPPPHLLPANPPKPISLAAALEAGWCPVDLPLRVLPLASVSSGLSSASTGGLTPGAGMHRNSVPVPMASVGTAGPPPDACMVASAGVPANMASVGTGGMPALLRAGSGGSAPGAATQMGGPMSAVSAYGTAPTAHHSSSNNNWNASTAATSLPLGSGANVSMPISQVAHSSATYIKGAMNTLPPFNTPPTTLAFSSAATTLPPFSNVATLPFGDLASSLPPLSGTPNTIAQPFGSSSTTLLAFNSSAYTTMPVGSISTLDATLPTFNNAANTSMPFNHPASSLPAFSNPSNVNTLFWGGAAANASPSVHHAATVTQPVLCSMPTAWTSGHTAPPLSAELTLQPASQVSMYSAQLPAITHTTSAPSFTYQSSSAPTAHDTALALFPAPNSTMPLSGDVPGVPPLVLQSLGTSSMAEGSAPMLQSFDSGNVAQAPPPELLSFNSGGIIVARGDVFAQQQQMMQNMGAQVMQSMQSQQQLWHSIQQQQGQAQMMQDVQQQQQQQQVQARMTQDVQQAQAQVEMMQGMQQQLQAQQQQQQAQTQTQMMQQQQQQHVQMMQDVQQQQDKTWDALMSVEQMAVQLASPPRTKDLLMADGISVSCSEGRELLMCAMDASTPASKTQQQQGRTQAMQVQMMQDMQQQQQQAMQSQATHSHSLPSFVGAPQSSLDLISSSHGMMAGTALHGVQDVMGMVQLSSSTAAVPDSCMAQLSAAATPEVELADQGRGLASHMHTQQGMASQTTMLQGTEAAVVVSPAVPDSIHTSTPDGPGGHGFEDAMGFGFNDASSLMLEPLEELLPGSPSNFN